MKKYIISFAVLMISAVCFPTAARAYSAKAMILTEKSSGAVLLEKNGDMCLPMASTTKIMTALVALENAELCEHVTVQPESVNIEGSSMYLTSGEVLTVKELLYGLMLSSGNDAASALALHVGGSEARFVEMMNSKAAELGLTSTHFANPSGLPADDHYTTARELAAVTAYALENSAFAEIVSSETAKVAYNGTADGRRLKNHNKLLSMYDGAVGVKTGFTERAGRCLVGAAERDGVTLICVTLNDGDDWNDHIRAFDYGFSAVKRVTLAEAGEISVPLQTPDGKSITAANVNEITAVVPFNADITYKITGCNFVYAPKSKGDFVACVTFFADGAEIHSERLYLTQSVEPPPVKRDLIFIRVINFIKRIIKD